VLGNEKSLSTDGKGMSGSISWRNENDDVDARSSPNMNGVTDGLDWGVPDVGLLGVGDTLLDVEWLSDANVVDNGVTTRGLQVELSVAFAEDMLSSAERRCGQRSAQSSVSTTMYLLLSP
jgi:hypothetical protein